jgi:gas vesicle protein
MERQNAECSGPAIGLAFIGGALVGAIAGLLLAPKSGQETRRAIKDYADKTEDEIIEKAKEARAALDETIERSKHYMAEKKADVEAAVKAGREAMKDKMEQCCR